jgi:hypothetical protein
LHAQVNHKQDGTPFIGEEEDQAERAAQIAQPLLRKICPKCNQKAPQHNREESGSGHAAQGFIHAGQTRQKEHYPQEQGR